MFDVEFNSIGQKTLAAPELVFGACFGGFFGVILCFFVGVFYFPQAQRCLDVLQGREMSRMESGLLL